MATILYHSLEANTSLLQSPYCMYNARIKRDFHILQHHAVSLQTMLSLLRNCHIKYGQVKKWLKNPQHYTFELTLFPCLGINQRETLEEISANKQL